MLQSKKLFVAPVVVEDSLGLAVAEEGLQLLGVGVVVEVGAEEFGHVAFEEFVGHFFGSLSVVAGEGKEVDLQEDAAVGESLEACEIAAEVAVAFGMCEDGFVAAGLEGEEEVFPVWGYAGLRECYEEVFGGGEPEEGVILGDEGFEVLV